MSNRKVNVEITPRARARLESLESPLKVEMEVYFSCLIRLRVLFPDAVKQEFIPVDVESSHLQLFFNPVMTAHCNVDEIRGRDPDTEYFPIQKPEKFIPKWLRLDYRKNKWQGEFGY